MNRVTVAQALKALDHMDDYARMTAGVNAVGARTLLERFISEHSVDEPKAPELLLLLPAAQTGDVPLMPELPPLMQEALSHETVSMPGGLPPENTLDGFTQAPLTTAQALGPVSSLHDLPPTNAAQMGEAPSSPPATGGKEPLSVALPLLEQFQPESTDAALPAAVVEPEVAGMPDAIKPSLPLCPLEATSDSPADEPLDEAAAYFYSQRQLGEAFEDRYPEIYQHRCAMGVVPCGGPEFDAMQADWEEFHPNARQRILKDGSVLGQPRTR